MFGYGPKVTQEKLRVAEALETLPVLAGELRAGGLNFSVVKELTRVATRDTEGDWLQVARGKTVRDVEQLVSGRRPGNLPESELARVFRAALLELAPARVEHRK